MEVTIIRKVELSMDEQKKYEVIKSLADHPAPNKQRAALTLGCTVRHINRMLKGYKEHGKAYFIHGNRGRKPANTIPNETRNLVVDLYRNKYYDANFEHFTELLGKHEDIYLSPSAVMSILEAEYILSPKATKAKKKRIKEQLKADKKAAKSQKEADQIQINLVALEDAHSRRPRAAYFGELQQMDATPYEWIPAQIWHLHLAIEMLQEELPAVGLIPRKPDAVLFSTIKIKRLLYLQLFLVAFSFIIVYTISNRGIFQGFHL